MWLYDGTWPHILFWWQPGAIIPTAWLYTSDGRQDKEGAQGHELQDLCTPTSEWKQPYCLRILNVGSQG